MEYCSMGKIANGYKVIKNILTKEEQLLLKGYTDIQHRFNTKNFDTMGQSDNMDTCFYEDPLMEALLLSKQSIMEKETNLKLFPTYSFWRMYTYGATLAKHTDRSSCEISVTINMAGDGTPWPIYIGKSEINLEPGDGVIYEGIDNEHWRDEYLGDGQAQVFLHYVDQNGDHKDWKYDKRHGIGYPITYKHN